MFLRNNNLFLLWGMIAPLSLAIIRCQLISGLDNQLPITGMVQTIFTNLTADGRPRTAILLQRGGLRSAVEKL
jgi:hypothetical protein